MKIMLRVALAAWSLANIGSANAGEVERTLAASQFIQIPGVAAQAPVQNFVLATAAQIDRVIHPYVTAQNHGPSLIAPNSNGGANSQPAQIVKPGRFDLPAT